MLGVLAETKSIAKDRQNKQQGFAFRGIDDVYNALHPILAKHGIFTTSEIVEERSEERSTKAGGLLLYRILRVRYTFWAADGSSVTTEVMGEGMDSGDKAASKALAIAHKYALLQAFAVPTGDDPDAESHEVTAERSPIEHAPQSTPFITPKQRALMFAKATEKGMPEDVLKARVKDLIGVESSSGIRKREFDTVLAVIDEYVPPSKHTTEPVADDDGQERLPY